MKSKQLISKNIEVFYTQASEETRLDRGMGVFEFERTKVLIAQYIPSPRSTIVDVGGGTGKYSEWLAHGGHKVHLIEPISKHIRQAQRRAKWLKQKFSILRGESRQLDLPDDYADLIILHGPLYHLQKEEDRNRTIREARRVLKDGGIILAFAINCTASTLAGLLNGAIHKHTFFTMCKEELATGLHNPPDDHPWLLAEAYYHRPDQLQEEFTAQGLYHLGTHAVEGMAWLDRDYFTHMLDRDKKDKLCELIAVTEEDAYLLPFSPHFMVAVKK